MAAIVRVGPVVPTCYPGFRHLSVEFRSRVWVRCLGNGDSLVLPFG